jgi:hypothetical protein
MLFHDPNALMLEALLRFDAALKSHQIAVGVNYA